MKSVPPNDLWHRVKRPQRPNRKGLAKSGRNSKWLKVADVVIRSKLRLLLQVRRQARSVLVHDRRCTENLPQWLVIPLLCGHVKNKLTCPKNLTIVLVHNRDRETTMERSLRFVGNLDYALAPVPRGVPWRHIFKIVATLEFMRNCAEPTEYVLFCDADDCVMRDDPQRAIFLLEKNDCSLLFSNTYNGNKYRYMPEVEQWVNEIAPPEATGGRYLNAGVWVGKWDFVLKFLEAASEFVLDADDPKAPVPVAFSKTGQVECTERFPYGVENDQTILRYLHPWFYPRVKVDYDSMLALRSNRGVLG